MDKFDIKEYLNSHKFTVLWSGGKDSTATLLWVLNNIMHERWNILYIEVSGNTHELCNQYVHEVAKELGVYNKLIHAKREDLDFFECIKKWGIPIFGKYRWCLYQFKQKLFIRYDYTIQVTGSKQSDSYRRKNIKPIEYFRQTGNILVAPIMTWSTKQVKRYILDHEIPLNPCYKLFNHSGNCMFCPYHSTASIVLTLNDPYWRNKIIETLQALRSKGVLQIRAYNMWRKRIGQTTLVGMLKKEKEII